MNILIIISLILSGIVALLLVAALFIRKKYNAQSEIIINAPAQKVFDYLKQLRNQDTFNKWVMVDPDMEREFRGTDGTVGFIYAWNGNKQAGEGEQEIKAIEEGKKIETEIRFVRPFAAIAYADMTTEPLSDNETKVTWSNSGKMKYPMNIIISTMEKALARDMDTSLSALKNIFEP